MSSTSQPQIFVASQLLTILKYRKIALGLFFGAIVFGWVPYLIYVVGILSIGIMFLLSKALRFNPWLFLVIAFVPVINLCAYFFLTYKAALVLKDHGLRVLFFNINKNDLPTLERLMAVEQGMSSVTVDVSKPTTRSSAASIPAFQAAPSYATTAEQRLHSLKILLEKDMVSESEYENKRQQILAEL